MVGHSVVSISHLTTRGGIEVGKDHSGISSVVVVVVVVVVVAMMLAASSARCSSIRCRHVIT